MTESLPAISLQEVIDCYFAMWNERSAHRRRSLIEQTWTPQASYIEQLMAVEGYGALEAGVAAMQARFRGFTLRPVGELQSHHSRVRWSWELIGDGDEMPVAVGTNIGVLAADGRLSSVIGFFDHTGGIPADVLPV